MKNSNNILMNGFPNYYKKRFVNKVKKLLAYLETEWNITVGDEFQNNITGENRTYSNPTKNWS